MDFIRVNRIVLIPINFKKLIAGRGFKSLIFKLLPETSRINE